MKSNEFKRLFIFTIIGLLLMLLSIILSACGNTRKITRQFTSETQRDSTFILVNHSQVNLSEIIRNHTSQAENETRIIIYDNTQPVNSTNGKPLIVAEINSKTKKTGEINEQHILTDNIQLEAKKEEVHYIDKLTDAIEEKEKKSLDTLGKLKNLIIAVGGLLLIVLIIRVIQRKNKTT